MGARETRPRGSQNDMTGRKCKDARSFCEANRPADTDHQKIKGVREVQLQRGLDPQIDRTKKEGKAGSVTTFRKAE